MNESVSIIFPIIIIMLLIIGGNYAGYKEGYKEGVAVTICNGKYLSTYYKDKKEYVLCEDKTIHEIQKEK